MGPGPRPSRAIYGLVAAGLHERGFVLYLSTLRTVPPMPWFDAVAMDDAELRSL